MPRTPIPFLLQQLGWPERAKNDRGSQTWTASNGDTVETLRSTSAAVMVGHDKIQARLRSANMGDAHGWMNAAVAWRIVGKTTGLARGRTDWRVKRISRDRAA